MRTLGAIWGWLRRTARDMWLLYRREGWRAPLADVRDAAWARIYTSNDQLIVKQELAVSNGSSGERGLRIEVGDRRHPPVLAESTARVQHTAHARVRAGAGGGPPRVPRVLDDRLIGYFWWLDPEQASRSYHVTRLGMELADDEMYGCEFYIAPEYHAGGTAASFLAGVESKLAELGYRSMYGTVESWNRRARWLYSLGGYRVVRRCRSPTLLQRIVLLDGKAYLSVGDSVRPIDPRVAIGRR
jgi:hypothetical protein